MKKIIAALLFTSGLFAQDQVYNVQKYCIDELPFVKGSCDISGNEYSFVFVDAKKKDVVLFIGGQKMQFKIVDVTKDPASTKYKLTNTAGEVAMNINAQSTRMEFLFPERRIYLTTGKSTKL
ncbi:MAG TPA: hypothetical protein VF581_04045 [Flavobacterium sp.]|jgi:hypothetical protein